MTDDTKRLDVIDAGDKGLDVVLTFSQTAEGTVIEAKTETGLSLRLSMPDGSDTDAIDTLFERFPEYLDTVTTYLLHHNKNNTTTNKE